MRVGSGYNRKGRMALVWAKSVTMPDTAERARKGSFSRMTNDE